jgi:hypothetical protein
VEDGEQEELHHQRPQEQLSGRLHTCPQLANIK